MQHSLTVAALKLHKLSATYSAKYRDGQGIVRKVTTGCRDEGAARSVLNELERRGELVRSGVLTAGEDRIADHAATPIAEHFDAYGEHLQAKGCCKVYRENTRRHLDRLAADCRFSRLGDFDRTAVQRWLADSFQSGQSEQGLSACRRNELDHRVGQ